MRHHAYSRHGRPPDVICGYIPCQTKAPCVPCQKVGRFSLSLSLLFQFSPIPVPPPASVLRCCVGCDPPPGRDCAAVRSPRSPLPCVPSDAGVIPHQLTTSVPSPYHHRTSTSTMPSPHHHRAITVPSPCHLRTITVPPPYQYQHHAIAPPPPCHHRAITVPSPYRHRTTVAVVPPSDHYSPIG